MNPLLLAIGIVGFNHWLDARFPAPPKPTKPPTPKRVYTRGERWGMGLSVAIGGPLLFACWFVSNMGVLGSIITGAILIPQFTLAAYHALKQPKQQALTTPSATDSTCSPALADTLNSHLEASY